MIGVQGVRSGVLCPFLTYVGGERGYPKAYAFSGFTGASPSLTIHCLFAARIGVEHPITSAKLEFGVILAQSKQAWPAIFFLQNTLSVWSIISIC